MFGKEQQSGFTLLEILVALSLFTIAIIMVTSMYSLSQRSYNQASAKAELAQNARVVTDRISRELRQSQDVATDLGQSSQEIMFEDGHDREDITYIKYYQDETDMRRAELAYYFEEEETVNVRYDTVNEDGELPDQRIIQDRLVGEYFKVVSFSGNEDLVNIDLGLEKENKTFNIRTRVNCRN
jgi:prepilin-type N-terminal cleavage/methylation domain-containing protein